MNLLFADTETTGKEEEDRLCQLCFRLGELEINKLYLPPLPIKFGAMAVHHITNEMVENAPSFEGSAEHMMLKALSYNTVFVAHNAPFDLKMLAKEGLTFPRAIDTLKIARYLDVESKLESYGLQYLRYFYELKVEAIAHDAMGDVRVLIAVFDVLAQELSVNENLQLEKVYERMLEISSSPALIRRFNFGKHKGTLVEEVARTDKNYLKWLQREKANNPEGEEDWLHTIDYYLR